MNILGISGFANSISFKRREFPGLTEREYNIAQGLDAAAALVSPSGIIAAAAEERFNRKKASNAFPVEAIRFCLERGGLKIQDVDFVAHGFSYEPHRAVIESDDYGQRQYQEVFAPELQKQLLARHFGEGYWEEKFVSVPHHLAHAASTFYPSGFEEALILVSDGMGEAASMTVGVGKGPDITELAQVSAFHSLGVLYGVFSLYLGFFMNSDEYKVMGLAPYGNGRRFFNQIMDFVSLRQDGTYTIPFFAHDRTLLDRETHRGVVNLLAQKFGPPREPEAEITQTHKDIAAALQAVLQTIQLHVLRHFKRQTGLKNLCLAGGVALNCSANGVIRRSELFDEVFVQPAAGDDGTALGAALYAQRMFDPDFKPRKISVPLWGPEFDSDAIAKAIGERQDVAVVPKESFAEVCKEVALRINRGEIIGWFQDRMEFGPRALGSRSILADPRDGGMRERINALVKKREGFRPFAPVVAAEKAAEIFEIQPGKEEGYAHMLYVTHVRPAFRDKLPATTHVDGSARAQTVTEQQNPKLWQLLNAFAESSGLPVLLNTSFNVRGQPIVCSPTEAIDTFLAAGLNALVLGDRILIPSKARAQVSQNRRSREELEETAAKHEEFWVNRLSALQPVSLPHRRKELVNSDEQAKVGHAVPSAPPTQPNEENSHYSAEGPSQDRNREQFGRVMQIRGALGTARPTHAKNGLLQEDLVADFAGFVGSLTGASELNLSLGDWQREEEIGDFEREFATWLPMSIRVDAAQRSRELTGSIRKELFKIREHSTYALDLRERHPGFPAHQSAALPLAVRFSKSANDCAFAPGSEVTLNIPPDGVELAWAYDPKVFDEDTVLAMTQQFDHFLRRLSDEPERPLGKICLLDEHEWQQAIEKWNDTESQFPNVLMHEPFEAQAAKTPDAVALAFEDQQLTYAELNARAEAVANELRKAGVQPDQAVGVCAEVSLEMMIGLLAVLKAGGAYLPLDPGFPKDRLAFMIEDSKVRVLLTQSSLRDALPQSSAEVLCIDSEGSSPSPQPSPPGEGDPSPLAVNKTEPWLADAQPGVHPLPRGKGDPLPIFGLESSGRPAEPLPKTLPLPAGEGRGEGEQIPQISGRAEIDPRHVQANGFSKPAPHNLAYVIYTSGSTGKPKGVAIEHRNVANFYFAMDKVLKTDPGVWLAVTSMSFDISVLELFWTLSRGFKVVLQPKAGARTKPQESSPSPRPRLDSFFTETSSAAPREGDPSDSLSTGVLASEPSTDAEIDRLGFSLFYFAADEGAGTGQKYRLLLEGAKFADANGFEAVWTPERHFHSFGGLYPNPSVTSAAVAAVTQRIKIRAGSVVAPLHDPIRIAEEWSLVDNLSNGRVGISFASGWQANDFVLAPDNYAPRKERMLEYIETVRRLWRGEKIPRKAPNGAEVPIGILPRPVQDELPIWLTASGNPETFKLAGELGANVLTHLLGQTMADLQKKIAIYRAAWKEAGHAGTGKVTLMLHTFVHPHAEFAREAVRKPFTAYLRTSADLIRNDPWAFSTFKRPASSRPEDRDLKTAKLSEEELDAIAEHAFGRYFETSGLFGTPAHCLELTAQFHAIGVTEIGCLIDFGLPDDLVLSGLQELTKLRNGARPASARDVALTEKVGWKIHSPSPLPSPPGEGEPFGSPSTALPFGEASGLQDVAAAGDSRAPEADYSIPAQILRHKVTHMQCTPSLAMMLLEDPRALESLRTLKKLLLGGEALPLSLVRKLDIRGEIFNMYGPTETTIWSAADRVDRSAHFVAIGRPIANTQFYIVDKELRPVPIGVPGELLIGGAGVVRGYWNRPELTAERFVPDPFRSGAGERLYRTGDLARYLPDGRIEFLGRLDHQVKLRGYRIELGEIETALRGHASVKDCVALVREDVPGDKRLVAYIIPQAKQALDSRQLRQFLSSRLPDYMVPSSFVPMDAFPLTPNGKLDRKALPKPDSQPPTAQTHDTPSNLTEAKIAEVMCGVLGIKKIGLHDDFFELGGNSLLATQLIARLREAFRWDLPLRLAFEFPTVESLAHAISSRERRPLAGENHAEPEIHAGETPAIPKGATPALPLSFAQQRIWFMHHLEPGSHYNDHFDLRIRGPLDASILEKALNEIVRRHQTLRSTFKNGDGQPELVIATDFSLSLPAINLEDVPLADREAKAVRMAVEDCLKPFDLENGPLFRTTLVRITDKDHLLILTFDHIVVDGWSHGVFLSELTALYQAFLNSRPSPLPDLPIQYTDYAAWQVEQFRQGALAPHLDYWKRQLQNAPPLLGLHADFPRPPAQSYRGAREFFRLDRQLMDKLSALGRRERCTSYMVLLAAFQVLLARHSGQTDLVIGTPVANRNRADVEPLIGSFMNTLALRADLSGQPSFKELLARVRHVVLDALAHQELPFEKLVAELQPARALGHGPLFQVMFILQNTPTPVSKAGEVSFRHFDIDGGSSKMDLTLNLEETAEGAEAWFEYATDLFKPETIRGFVSEYRGLLEQVCADPEKRIQVAETPSDKVPRASSVGVTRSPGQYSASERLNERLMDPDEIENASSLEQIERALARIWSDVLGVTSVAPDDNLFDLGGHSLLVTQIISRIRKKFGVEIPIHHFFEKPTVALISKLIETQLHQLPSTSREVTFFARSAANSGKA